MATPTLTRHAIPGALGDILIDVRTGQRSTPRPAVVVVHGFKGFKDFAMFPPFADRAARAGFTAVSLNLSGSGVDHSGTFVWPRRFGSNTFSKEVADIDRVIAALDTGALGFAAPSSVGMVGHSRGGGTAILASSRNPRVGALVTWAAISSVRRWDLDQARRWRAEGVHPVVNSRTGETIPLSTDTLDDVEQNAAGALDIRRAAATLAVPWLIVHGTGDESVPFTEGEALAGVAPPRSSQLLAIEGAGHGFGAVHPFAGSTPELERVFDETIGWFSRHLA